MLQSMQTVKPQKKRKLSPPEEAVAECREEDNDVAANGKCSEGTPEISVENTIPTLKKHILHHPSCDLLCSGEDT